MTSRTPLGPRSTAPLMGLAALLIVNSHLEFLYPARFMAADGLTGIILFFILSGYGVTLGQRQNADDFAPFALRRATRIYPSLWLTLLAAHALDPTQTLSASPSTLFQRAVWPTDYAFLTQILVFYPVIWALCRLGLRATLFVTAGAAACWLASAVSLTFEADPRNLSLGQLPGHLWWSFYFLATCLGSLAARLDVRFPERPQWWLAWALGAFLYLILKFELSVRMVSLPEVIPSAAIGGVLQALALGIGLSVVAGHEHVNALLKKTALIGPMAALGAISLQMYLLHMLFADFVTALPLAWYFKVLVFFGATIAASIVMVQAISFFAAVFSSMRRSVKQ